MPKRRYVPGDLSEPEAAVQAYQGQFIGKTVDERPVRDMSSKELRELLFTLTLDKDVSRRKVWHERQAEKVRNELKRRGA